MFFMLYFISEMIHCHGSVVEAMYFDLMIVIHNLIHICSIFAHSFSHRLVSWLHKHDLACLKFDIILFDNHMAHELHNMQSIYMHYVFILYLLIVDPKFPFVGALSNHE